MMRVYPAIVAAAIGMVGASLSAGAAIRHERCDAVKITSIGPRLEGVPESGSRVIYSNKVHQVTYDPIPGLARARVGDTVRLCLIARPTNCPAGDRRGSRYAATDLRTDERWTAIDSSHRCRGA